MIAIFPEVVATNEAVYPASITVSTKPTGRPKYDRVLVIRHDPAKRGRFEPIFVRKGVDWIPCRAFNLCVFTQPGSFPDSCNRLVVGPSVWSSCATCRIMDESFASIGVREMGDTHDINRCVDLLASGGVVAIPTETVYGLAADAANAQAVSRIFAIKKRPTNHPLIVHLGEVSWLDHWATDIPESARLMARSFWPGPLTLVLNRHPDVLPAVTGGQDSVAVRMPAHPLTLQLIRTFGRPVVAPSANRFTKLSPTSAADVRTELGAAVDFILDGGPCRVGVESTIVDLRNGTAKLLRPGGIPSERIEAVLHRSLDAGDGSVHVPGQHPLHYSPDAKVSLVRAEDLVDQAISLSREGQRVGVLLPHGMDGRSLYSEAHVVPIVVPASVDDYASALYRFMRKFDQAGCDVVLASLPEAQGLGSALCDRLRRAAGPRS